MIDLPQRMNAVLPESAATEAPRASVLVVACNGAASLPILTPDRLLYDPADACVTVRLSRHTCILEAATFSIANVPVIGCDLGVSAMALWAVGGTDSSVGPGSRIGSGDNADMFHRLLRIGRAVAYVPQILVGHNHGRKGAEDVAQIARPYALGRGAFYLKYALHGDSWIARSANCEFVGLLKNWIRNGLFTRQAMQSLRTIGLLVVGAVRFLRFGQRPVPQQTRPV